ncbi:hypothetical protein [Dankookia sp. P2]|uniref:hypothetical protein n=1 Tax=Dankookia sp. P2 TaxID=3423955 RepID=UPI003D67D98D
MPLDLLLQGIWDRRWRVLLATLLLYAALACILFQLPQRHVAQAVVAPAETTSIATSTLLSPVPLFGGGLLDDRPTGTSRSISTPSARRRLRRCWRATPACWRTWPSAAPRHPSVGCASGLACGWRPTSTTRRTGSSATSPPPRTSPPSPSP